MWGPIQQELALQGWRSYAIDLPGHGAQARYPVSYQAPQDLEAFAAEPSTLAGVTLDDNVAALEAAVRRLRGLQEHSPVVLVASSLGGVTATVFANRHPELVDGLVYISAWACASRESPLEYMAEPEFAESLLPGLGGLNVEVDPAWGVGRANYRTADPELLGLLKASLMDEADDQQFMAFLNSMEPDESAAVMMGDARLDPDTWGTVPHTYLRLLQDRSLPIAMQDRLIAEADALTPDNPFTVHTLDASHAGFIHRSDEVVRVLTGGPATR